MTEPTAPDGSRAPAGREQPWSDDPAAPARVVAVTDNPIGRAVCEIARIAGRQTVLLADEDVDPMPLAWLAANPLAAQDAIVLCDHDTPEMEALLRAALAGEAGYVVATMGSRRRAEHIRELLADLPPETLARLHVPAGLNTGGRAPGEIALSVVAQVVAVAHGRDGGPMGG